MSSTSCFSIAIRSMPNPHAYPFHCVGSMPPLRSTCGWTMPQPPTSSHPLCLQLLHPTPPQMPHETSNSKLGSVKGKRSEERRVGKECREEGAEADQKRD